MTDQYNEEWTHDDMDEDIRQKEELLEEVKALAEGEHGEDAVRQVNGLKRRWRSIHYWESSFEDELETQFNEYLDKIFASRTTVWKAVIERKEALIEEAKKISQTGDFRKGTTQMNELMDAWKAAGVADRETNDKLWHEFQAAREVFYERRRQNQKDMAAHYAQVKELKGARIEEAKGLLEPANWNKATNQMDDIMNRWKEAGSAGRDNEPALWDEFSALRKNFYSQRSSYFEGIRKQQKANLEAKREIVAEAKSLAEAGDFAREKIDRMKELSQEWKKIGYCGKESDDAVWKEFRSHADAFFDALKDNREQRHQDWVYRMEDAKDRKQELIAEQKRRIRRLEDELRGLISQGRAEEIEGMIAEKEDFIDRLEGEISDIDTKISEPRG